MNKQLAQILNQLKELLPIIKEKYFVESIEVLGSYIRDQQTGTSDFDLLVTYSKTPGMPKFMELENYLSGELNIKVDLVMKDSIKPALTENILSHTIPVQKNKLHDSVKYES